MSAAEPQLKPMSDKALTEMARRQAGRWSLALAPAAQRHWTMAQIADDARDLLDEVRRLRAVEAVAESETIRAERDALQRRLDRATSEQQRLRALLDAERGE